MATETRHNLSSLKPPTTILDYRYRDHSLDSALLLATQFETTVPDRVPQRMLLSTSGAITKPGALTAYLNYYRALLLHEVIVGEKPLFTRTGCMPGGADLHVLIKWHRPLSQSLLSQTLLLFNRAFQDGDLGLG